MTRQMINIQTLGDPGPVYIEGPCLHDLEDVVPVESVTGEIVAQLCTECDTQLPAAYAPWPTGYLVPPAFLANRDVDDRR